MAATSEEEQGVAPALAGEEAPTQSAEPSPAENDDESARERDAELEDTHGSDESAKAAPSGVDSASEDSDEQPSRAADGGAGEREESHSANGETAPGVASEPVDGEKDAEPAPADVPSAAEPADAEQNAATPADAEQNAAQPADAEQNASQPAEAEQNAATPAEAAANKTPQAPPEEEEDKDAYRVKLDMFEGPLDLLLHLIRKHELDILDIPVSFITKKYLEYLDLLGAVAIDVASEYLVMAATLTHIKSKMLLPAEPSDQADEEGEEEYVDPRSELVRRLLEYQKYKHVAAQLGGRAALGRDVFARGGAEPVPEGPAPLAAGNVFKLFDAFEKVLKRAHQEADHQVLFERVGIAERIVELTELLHDNKRMRFDDLFIVTDADGNPKEPTRLDLVVTFLALLEMCKMRVARIVQDDPLGEIEIEFAAKHRSGADPSTEGADTVLHPDTDPWQERGLASEPGIDSADDGVSDSEPELADETNDPEDP